jgi:hypothetical protein
MPSNSLSQSVEWQGYGLDERVSITSREDFFPEPSEQLWSSPNLLSNGYRLLSSWLKRPGLEANQSHIVPRLRRCGIILPLPHASTCCGAYLSINDYFTFYISFYNRLFFDFQLFKVSKCGAITKCRRSRISLKPKLVQIIFKNPVRTGKKTPHFTVTKINRLTAV